jgi:hypothetical protein
MGDICPGQHWHNGICNIKPLKSKGEVGQSDMTVLIDWQIVWKYKCCDSRVVLAEVPLGGQSENLTMHG